MEKQTPKQKLQDIYLDLNIRRFAERYFQKSGSWLYHKFDQVDNNNSGKPQDFTADELTTLKNGLYDYARRITAAADML